MVRRSKLSRVLPAALAAAMLVSACSANTENKETTAGTGDNTQTTADSNNPGGETKSGDDKPEPVVPEGHYTYYDRVVTLSSNWNPHTYKTVDEAYPQDYTRSALYKMVFNDASHPIAGREDYSAYVIIPEMATGEPVDVTAQVKKDHPEYNIPESAESGYAWEVTLRDDLCFDNGHKITPDTYIESLKRLLDPKLLNYRASDAYDGTYAIANAKEYALAGVANFKSFDDAGTDYEAYIADGHTDDEVFVDLDGFWGVSAANGKKYAAITDDTMVRDPAVKEGDPEAYVSAKYLWDNYLAPGQVYEAYASTYTGIESVDYEAGYDFANVGLFKSGDNKLTYVFRNSLDGFYLKIYAMDSFWLIDPEEYDKYLKEMKTASGSVWSSTYDTNAATAVSYGPYKVSDYQLDKSMHFVRNDSWFGYKDGNHTYVDPVDGETYNMFMTDEIDTQVITETATAKNMFLSGQLMTYGLQSEDFSEYKNSEFLKTAPGQTVFFFIFNGYKSVIEEREAAADFDKKTTDLESMTLTSFRKAVAVTFDKQLMCDTLFPSNVPGYGLLGTTNIYDPETCAYYRDTDVAKLALCDFYSVDVSKFASLDDAVDSITGYDPEAAKKFFNDAFKEALEAGFITDENGDGVSDQTVTITYSVSSETDRTNKLVEYLNEKFNDVTKGTGFEGKVKIVKSAPLGNDWSDKFREGTVDFAFAGWNGSAMDPFGTTDVYVNPDMAYDGNWFDATKVPMTLTLNGEEITMSLYQWSDCLNGKTVSVDGKEYNFGYGVADAETRLQILAGFEKAILATYDYIPMLTDGEMFLLSQKAFYVVDEYNPVMSFGGIDYLKYNYSDEEWDAYVKEQGGTLKY